MLGSSKSRKLKYFACLQFVKNKWKERKKEKPAKPFTVHFFSHFTTMSHMLLVHPIKMKLVVLNGVQVPCYCTALVALLFMSLTVTVVTVKIKKNVWSQKTNCDCEDFGQQGHSTSNLCNANMQTQVLKWAEDAFNRKLVRVWRQRTGSWCRWFNTQALLNQGLHNF